MDFLTVVRVGVVRRFLSSEALKVTKIVGIRLRNASCLRTGCLTPAEMEATHFASVPEIALDHSMRSLLLFPYHQFRNLV